LFRELHGSVDEEVKFDLTWKWAINFQVKSDLFEKIKATQNRDDSLLRIKDEVEQGKAADVVIDEDDVLRYENRLYVSNTDDLRR